MKFPLFTFLILLSKIIFSQNLVFNGDFETVERYPDNYAQISLATGWYTLNRADLYNSRSNPFYFNMAMPGLRTPRTGNGFAGIVVGEHETIQTKLTQTLSKDSQYRVEFYLKLAWCSQCALTPVFGLLTKYSCMDSIYRYENFNNQVGIYEYKELMDTTKWVKVEGIYTANGGEKYFTLTYINLFKKPFCLCDYFIDDISVYPLVDEHTILQNITSIDTFKYKQGDVFILKNVNFEFNQSTLLPESYKTLEELIKYLQKNSSIVISINGHTDNVGLEKYNYELSKERAKSVYNFLLNRGINKERLSYAGFGSTQPLNENTSEKNKQNNRRVEIKIVKKN
ncbi:MAG: OmpA family protein [Bacteroidales bacterium]|nr:OmpA family protein [Bacteroidales bacterium]